jgi:hypothetical protein
MSSTVKAFFESDEWLASNYADYVLWHAVNSSLDLTIERLGRSRFNSKLQKFLYLKELVIRECNERLGQGCSDSGEPLEHQEPCYERDFGCGFSCIDEQLSSIGE